MIMKAGLSLIWHKCNGLDFWLWETTSVFLCIHVWYGFTKRFMDSWNVRHVTCQPPRLTTHIALYCGSQTVRVGKAPELRHALFSCSWAKLEDLLISCGISSLAAIQSELSHGSCSLPSSLSKLLEVYESQTYSLHNEFNFTALILSIQPFQEASIVVLMYEQQKHCTLVQEASCGLTEHSRSTCTAHCSQADFSGTHSTVNTVQSIYRASSYSVLSHRLVVQRMVVGCDAF